MRICFESLDGTLRIVYVPVTANGMWITGYSGEFYALCDELDIIKTIKIWRTEYSGEFYALCDEPDIIKVIKMGKNKAAGTPL
jgi:hypothetical protein